MSRIDIICQILGFVGSLRDVCENLPRQELQIVSIIRQGLHVAAAMRVAEFYGISEAKVATLLGSSERTLSRRKKEDKPLDSTESDRLYRLARIAARATEVFENDDTARNWLKRPNRALAGVAPYELLDTDAGTEQVDELLNRIDYGVYS